VENKAMLGQLKLNTETISAIFIIALVSVFILTNFLSGYILPLFLITIAVASVLAFLYPRSGVYATIFLTFVFERFFTLQPIILGRTEYKLYPIDFILGAVILGIIWKMILGNLSLRSRLGARSNPELNSWDCHVVPSSTNDRTARKDKLNNSDWLMVLFVIISGIYFLASALFTQSEFNLAFSSFKNYSFYSLFYFVIIILFQSKEQILSLFKFALAGGVAIIFFILWGIFTGTGLWSEYTPLSTEGVRLLAFTHGFYLSLALIGMFAAFIYQRGLSKAYYFLFGIWTVGILASMMRHLWVALAVALLGLFLLSGKIQKINFQKLVVKYFFGVLAILILTWYLGIIFPYSTFEQANSTVQSVLNQRLGSLGSVSTDESFAWRNVVWRQAYNEYVNHPVTGIGFGKYVSMEIGDYRDYVEVRNIHNSLLVILVQMGIIGITIFVSFIFLIGKKLIFKKDKDWMDIAIITLMIFYFGVFMFQPYLETNLLGIFFWMILGLARIRAYVIPIPPWRERNLLKDLIKSLSADRQASIHPEFSGYPYENTGNQQILLSKSRR
jgi:O-antigen ligase